MITDINEDMIYVNDRVIEPFGDSYPRVGTIDAIHDGTVYVLWDGDAETNALRPVRLQLVKGGA